MRFEIKKHEIAEEVQEMNESKKMKWFLPLQESSGFAEGERKTVCAITVTGMVAIEIAAILRRGLLASLTWG